MPHGRLFFSHIADVQRVAHALESGTIQDDVTFVTVSGMTSLEVSLMPISAYKVPTDLGIAYGEAFRITFDADVLPAGAEVREGDRVVVDSVYYTIRESTLVQLLGLSHSWDCIAERKMG